MIAQWGVMRADAGLALNYYGPCVIEATTAEGGAVRFRQETNYPLDGEVTLEVAAEPAAPFPLRPRIPFWSAETAVAINGQPVDGPRPGRYCVIERTWQAGDKVSIRLDFRLRAYAGGETYTDRFCLFRGPLALAFDARHNTLDPQDLRPIDSTTLAISPVPWEGAIAPWFLGELHDGQGLVGRVCDFSSAGQTGNHYRSWLPLAPGSGAPAFRAAMNPE